jgi:hypothetical protein
MRNFIYAFSFIIAIALIIDGIIEAQYGVTGGGIIIAGITVQQWLQGKNNNKGNTN